MSERPGTVAAYAAGASLAAVTLFYVFGPNFIIDGDDSGSNSRKKAIVGLSNPANDCFINSVLQALAGLGELRFYLNRELHRRQIDGPAIYDALPNPEDLPRGENPEKVRLLQQEPVTRALKEMLDGLNERPISKKTISARPFIQALETAFQTRISRNQQDAHEFLQVVVERLCDEYHASAKARERSSGFLGQSRPEGRLNGVDSGANTPNNGPEKPSITVRSGDAKPETPSEEKTRSNDTNDEHAFPLEGKLESQVECQFCKYKYKPNPTSFVNLSLQVPQKSSTTLSSCFDGLLKTEFIEDFRCDRCQLQFLLEQNEKAAIRARSEEELHKIEHQISLIRQGLDNDPEAPPEGIAIPDPAKIPRRKIARHMRITMFPKVIAIHLSRSIFDRSSSTKNAAKVSFPERLPIGGILDRKWYKLLGIVCHKGSHQSGHYESFRRNHVYAPFSTPDTFRSYAQSRSASENPSTMPSPRLNPSQKPSSQPTEPTEPPESSLSNPPYDSHQSPSSGSVSSSSLPPTHSSPAPSRSPSIASKQDIRAGKAPASPHRPPTSSSPSSKLRQATRSRPTTGSSEATPQQSPLVVPPRDSTTSKPSSASSTSLFRRKKRQAERWWRISDEKVKDCKTSDVLDMQKDVYLLFYELEKPGDEDIDGRT